MIWFFLSKIRIQDGEKLTELEQQRSQLTTEEKQLRQKLSDEKRIHTQIKNDLKVNNCITRFCIKICLIEFTNSR